MEGRKGFEVFFASLASLRLKLKVEIFALNNVNIS
jgi:hypothetical protein